MSNLNDSLEATPDRIPAVNGSDGPVRVLMVSEMDGPNVSVYPDTNQIGLFDSARRAQRRFGARFDVDDAISGYGGGKATLTAPAPGPRHRA